MVVGKNGLYFTPDGHGSNHEMAVNWGVYRGLSFPQVFDNPFTQAWCLAQCKQ
jgi:hypothetical protein